jgi:TRAP-type C4-dicarboxylate transport system substrate-binding protein
MNRTSALVLAIAVAIMTAACDTAPSRLGTETEAVTLASVDSSSGSDVLAALVASTADQPVHVDEPIASTGTPEAEFDALDTVIDGDADLTVVRAGALAQRGADSLAVLQTPLLVVSPEHAAKVAASPVAAELMADLDKLGLTGVALVPGGVRHPFGYGRALYGAEDYQGAVVNSGPANGVNPMLEALGAQVDDSVGVDRSHRVADGGLTGIEASLMAASAVDRPAVLTSNVTLYAKFDVVVVRADAWDGMSKTQQDALRKAATTAGQQAVDERGDEASALDSWCALPSAASVTATPEQVRSIAVALEPAIEAATGTDSAQALADKVATLAEGTKPPVGKVCGDVAIGTTNEEFLVERVGDQNVFDGVWRVDAKPEDFVAAGVPADEARNNAGVWTIRVDGHLATVDQPVGEDCSWDFYVNGDQVSLDFLYDGNDACYGLALGTWRRSGDVVTFDWEKERFYDVAIDQALFAGGMHKIG